MTWVGLSFIVCRNFRLGYFLYNAFISFFHYVADPASAHPPSPPLRIFPSCFPLCCVFTRGVGVSDRCMSCPVLRVTRPLVKDRRENIDVCRILVYRSTLFEHPPVCAKSCMRYNGQCFFSSQKRSRETDR